MVNQHEYKSKIGRTQMYRPLTFLACLARQTSISSMLRLGAPSSLGAPRCLVLLFSSYTTRSIKLETFLSRSDSLVSLGL